jgi:hypothetical protein
VEYVVALVVLLTLVALVVAGPLRPGAGAAGEAREDARRAELEAAKEAKYREIHDAELDHRMGKLSEEDWRRVDRELRGEAIEILGRLDELEGGEPEADRRAADR